MFGFSSSIAAQCAAVKRGCPVNASVQRSRIVPTAVDGKSQLKSLPNSRNDAECVAYGIRISD